MNDLPDRTILLFGLSSTGKTNFLVALDVALDEQAASEALVHEDLAADRTYLQPLKEKWLRGEELEHTSRQQPPPPHQIIVRHPQTGTTAGLYLPDLAGENFDSYFETRSFPADFAQRVTQASGLLLFVHSDQEADHTLHEALIFRDATPAEIPPASSGWRLQDAARQVKLVDLMQFVAEVRDWRVPLRVAIIISAWDLIDKAQDLPAGARAELPADPSRFLTARWPLLDQFLRSHEGLFPSRVFGVSARGGGTTEDEVARLMTFERPSDRIVVVDSTSRSNDLTRPVRWLLNLLD